MKSLLLLVILFSYSPPKHATTYKFINGNWFNGTSFEKRDVYVKDGLFSESLAQVDTTVDLTGKYVVPPFSETHTHLLEGIGNYQEVVNTYLSQGVFYIKNPNNIQPLTEKVKAIVNNPHSIDAVFANGGLTCTGGHPETLYEDVLRTSHLASLFGSAPRGYFKGKSYFNVDSESDFQKEWPIIKEGKPDFIKIYFANSEDIGRTPPKSASPLRKGLNPQLAKIIVAKAHEDGYRVAAHVETRMDFINALDAGVDEITHTPGFFLFSKDELDRYRLKKEDAELAAKKNVFVTTAINSRNLTQDASLQPLVDEVMAYNIKLLKSAGVRITIGSDHARSPLEEIASLRKLNALDNLSILQAWCVTSAESIFPNRKLGKLEKGYEGSFLALDGNPLTDFSNTEKIAVRFKQGHFINALGH
jgi:hypothetical protein